MLSLKVRIKGCEGELRTEIFGVGFDDMTAEQAVSFANDTINAGEKAYIVTPNPEIVWIARKDKPLRDSINSAALVLPDGVGIILAAKILGTPLRELIPGIDFTTLLLDKLSNSGGSVFLLGAKPGVAEEASRKLIDSHPGLVIAGVADGYFTDDRPVIEQINSACPDLLLVCLGAPKQELWMAGSISKLNVRICVGLGGALDVFAGTVKRAPMLFRRLGLEWLYRLIREPRRIKRMIKLPLFILAILLMRLRRR